MDCLNPSPFQDLSLSPLSIKLQTILQRRRREREREREKEKKSEREMEKEKKREFM